MVNDLFALAPQVLALEGPLVMVTLTATAGSSYRKPGARLVLSQAQTWGLLSGGCIEQEVAKRCRPVLAGEQEGLQVELDTRRFLGCDGRLTLWAERIPREFFVEVEARRRERQPTYCATFPGILGASSRLCEAPIEGAFNQLLTPARRLLAFGSGPDVAPLLELAQALSWESEQIVLASEPEVGTQTHWTILPSADKVSSLRLDSWTACVVMNHHFGRDAELLRALWKAPTPFLGLLGSRKRRDLLLEELAFGDADVDLESRTLHAPVGLKLGADGPKEIALEICAQVQRVLAGCVASPGKLNR